MFNSAACEYAIRALTHIALRGAPGDYFLLRSIAREEKLPPYFMSKVFQALVRAGILESAKGRGGGFALQRPAAKILLRDIVRAVERDDRTEQCPLGMPTCDDQQPCAAHELWKTPQEHLRRFLAETTLADLAAALRAKRAQLGLEGPHRRGRPHSE